MSDEELAKKQFGRSYWSDKHDAYVDGLRAGRDAERERCAKIAETGAIDRCYREETDNGVCGVEIAAAIRGGGGSGT